MPNAESHPWGYQRSSKDIAGHIVKLITRGDLRVTGDIESTDMPYRPGRLVVSPSGVLQRPRPTREWTEFPPIARIVETIPVPVVRLVSRRPSNDGPIRSYH